VLSPTSDEGSQPLIIREVPHRVRELENVFIPLADGTRLAARIFLPEDAEQRPVPAILEYLPYRKRDGTGERDALTHPYFAGHGYAGVRVDLRGSGESDGLLADEYLKQEQDDGLEVIDWIARQSWCTGAVGMMGISWGGFNGLQVAARRPPALKAVITLCSTDDRYADDIHFMGGALLNAKLVWASTMFAYMSRPPDPALVGERWREMWLERLRHMPLFIDLWLRHQRRDEFWKHGSVCEDYARIACPVYAVGGWADGYSNAIPRLLAGLSVPRKGLIGPWAHKYPHFALPGPPIGFLQEALRWWDKWLKGIETGIMDEPMLRAWMLESARPAVWYGERAGRWVAEPAWPARAIEKRRLFLTDAGLAESAGPEQAVLIASPESTGLQAGVWCSHGTSPDEPGDQRDDDAKSIVYDTAPLAGRTEILGAPVVELELSADRPNAKIAVRLCDVHPDGASTRVTYGLLNLTHRDGHETPQALEPGSRYRVRVQLNDIGYAFPPGHRIRLALSSAYWPIAWPSPERAAITLYPGSSALLLPMRVPRAADDALPPLPPPESAPPQRRTVLRAARCERLAGRDNATGETFYRALDDHGDARIEEHGLEIGSVKQTEFRIKDEDPLSARAETRWTQRVGRGAWQTRTETRTVMTATEGAFEIRAELDAYEGDERVWSQNWSRTVPRDLV
jgi:putative CocE/NonD family hydrolase